MLTSKVPVTQSAVVVVPRILADGTRTYLLAILEELRGRSISLTLVVRAPMTPEDRAYLASLCEPIIVLSPRTVLEARSKIRSASLIWLWFNYGEQVSAILRPRRSARVIYSTVSTEMSELNTGWRTARSRKCTRLGSLRTIILSKVARRRINIVTVVSPLAAATAGRLFRDSEVVELIPGMTVTRIEALKRAAQTKTEPFRVVCIGRLHRSKNVDTVVRAWGEIASRVPEYELSIVGTGAEEANLRRLVRDLGIPRVVFSGVRADIADILAESACYVSASLLEGYVGYGALEAAIAKVPIVASDIPEVASVLGKYEAVRLVPSNDQSGYAEAIRRALTEAPDIDELEALARDVESIMSRERFSDSVRSIVAGA